MVLKLVEQSQRGWRRPDGYQLILLLLDRRRFKDGMIDETYCNAA